MKRIILVTTSMCIASTAFGGGYRLALQGQKALGMGHTGVAMTDSSEVVFFNPAGMSALNSDLEITGGLNLIQSETQYQNETSNASADSDNPIGTPLNLYLVKKFDDKVSYGVGLYTPYGNSVEWEKDWAGSHLVNDIELKAIFIQPTVGYQINDQYSVGFGPVYVTGSVEFNRNLSTSLIDGEGNKANVTVEASNIDAWGYNMGFMAKPSEQITLGISYRSKIELEANDEDADFENIPSSLAAAFPDTTFNADLVLPAELTLGLAYHVNQNTTLAFDFNRTYWSAYKNLDISFDNAAGTSLNPRNYKDSNAYRVGVQHNVDQWILRSGLYLDKSPVKRGYYTPETARNDSIGFTAGTTYKISSALEIDASFLYLHLDEFEGGYDFVDQSGTLISFSGDYKSSAISLGAGVRYQF